MLSDVVAEVVGSVREVTFVAVRARAALHKSATQPRLVQTGHRVFSWPMFAHFMHKITLKIRIKNRKNLPTWVEI